MFTRLSRSLPLFQRLENAIDLIAQYDPPTFRHLQRRMRRIHLTLLGTYQARWLNDHKTCELDQRHVEDEATSIEELAGAIVHELAHARIDAFGIEFSPATAARIERLCYAAARNFGRRLPAGHGVVAHAETAIALPDSTWTPAAERERRVSELRRLGTSEWLVRLYMWVTRGRAA